jgi:hypothetical protein
MANDIAIVKDRWLDIADRLKDMPMPFQRDIFLLECHVARTMHVDDILAKAKDIDVGAALALKREPENENDGLAILVETVGGDKLGYVPRSHNPVLARLMDAGKLLTTKVVHKELEDHWLNIRIEIYMKDV